MIKYRTGSYGVPIEEVKIDREKENSVWFNGPRNAKRSEWYNYFDTWEQAHKYLLNKYQETLLSTERKLKAAQREYDEIKKLNAP